MWEVYFGEEIMGNTQVSEWLFKLRIDVKSVEYSENSRRPSTSKTDENVDRE
jgi:hypothetical protein